MIRISCLQVVLNLLKNASEAAGAGGGTIRLRTYFEHSFRLRRSDGSGHSLPLQIEIIDDGPGRVRTDIISDIFDPFVSGKENGTGLGLALWSAKSSRTTTVGFRRNRFRAEPFSACHCGAHRVTHNRAVIGKQRRAPDGWHSIGCR